MIDEAVGSAADGSPEDEEVRFLKRSNHDFRVRLDRLEMERVRFVAHIAELVARHDREVSDLRCQVADLHRLVEELNKERYA